MSLPGKNINPFTFSFGLNTENQQKISFIPENKNNNNKISLFNQKDNNSGISFMNSPNNNNDNKSNFSLFNKPNFKDFLNDKSTDKLFLNNDKENENKVLFDNLNISNSKFFSGNETFKQYNNINNINNINNNYANNDNNYKNKQNNNLNTNNVTFLSNDKQNKNNIIKNNKLYENYIFSRTNNRINKVDNNDKIINNEKNDENININNILNNINNNNININSELENNQNFKLSECKDLNDYEKTQLLYKTNDEILEDLKSLLFLQQEKFKKCVENTRNLENKFGNLQKLSKKNMQNSENNMIKTNELFEKMNITIEINNKLKNEITNKNNLISNALLKYKNKILNNNILFGGINNNNIFKIYEDMLDISGKCIKIENNINYSEHILNEKEKNNSNNKINNNDDYDGIFIERTNKEKIYINQNKMNTLLNDCYQGLINLKNMQENIDSKYELLKKKLVRNNEKF